MSYHTPKYDFTEWFENEVRIYEPTLRAFLKRHEKEAADIDDIMQETYRRIIEVKKRKPIHSPRGLLIAIARNVSRDRVREKYANNTFSVVELDELPVHDDESQVIDVLTQVEDVSVLTSAVASLPDRCREVLMLKIYNSLPHKDIARQMGISVNTVETQLARALKKCRKYFKNKGYKLEV